MYIICEIDRQSRLDAWDRVLRDGALGWPGGMGWEGRWERVSGGGAHVHPWLINVNVWQKPPQYCKVISLQLKLKKKSIRSSKKKKNKLITETQQAQSHKLVWSLVIQKAFKALQIALLQAPTLSLSTGLEFSSLLKIKAVATLLKGNCYYCFANA